MQTAANICLFRVSREGNLCSADAATESGGIDVTPCTLRSL